MCGASSEEMAAFENIKNVASQLNNSFSTIFKGNENILGKLKSSLSPIIAAGPGQFGFTKPEEAAMRTGATEQITQAGNLAERKLRSELATQGGGNVYLPSGAQASLEGAMAQDTAQKQAAAQLGITQKGYETGRQNFFQAAQELPSATATLEQPITSAGSQALSGAKEESGAAQQITQAQHAWIAPVAGMIGAIGGMALGGPSGLLKKK